jgi:uncharacterized protein (DUF885 family)
MTSLRSLLAFVACLLTLGCASTATQLSPSQRLLALADEAVEREFDLYPDGEAFAQGRGRRAGLELSGYTDAENERARGAVRELLRRLREIPRDGLSESDGYTYVVLQQRLESTLARLDSPWIQLEVLTPGWGLHARLVVLASASQPFETEADFEAWLSRVDGHVATLDRAVIALEEARRKGWTVSRRLVERSLVQMQAVTSKKATEGAMWAPVARYPKNASPEKRADFEGRYRETLEKRYLPALRRFEDHVRSQYLPAARTTTGIGALPGGDQAYRAAIRRFTTLELSPDEVHRTGLAEVARIAPKLLETARGLGFRGEMKDLGAWTTSTAPKPFRTGEEILDYMRGVHARVEPHLPRLFKRLPKARLEIRQMPPEIASGSVTYTGPSEDGSRPGIVMYPVGNPATTSSAGLTALFLHEGVPGHHLDIGLKRELDIPRIRKLFSLTVYSEGWALYAESLGHELGVYDDPWALLGRYSGELHRAARLVVDTGMHAKGWSREEAIRYLVEQRGSTEGSATAAIERYMANPGQALAYKTGEMEILALRAAAQARLGAKFDVREFHDVVLAEGQLSLPLLRARLEKWIVQSSS